MKAQPGPFLAILLALLSWSCAPAASPPSAVPAQPTSIPAAGETAAPLMPLKVSFSNFASLSPIYLAYKNRYFEDAGLQVELVNITATNEVYPALISGQVDVALWTLSAAVFNAAAQGIHVKFVADKGYSDPESCAADAWLASEQAIANGLSDFSTLKGRTVSATRGSISEYSLDLMLEEAGLTSDDVEWTQISDNASKVEALRSGSIDLVALGEPWVTHAQRQGAGQIWRRYSDLMPRQSLGFVSYGPNMLDHNHEAGVRFMMAYLRGVDLFREGKTEDNLANIAEFTSLSVDDLKAACWNSFKADGLAETQGLLDYQDWLISKGILDAPLALDEFWTDEFVKEAAERLGR